MGSPLVVTRALGYARYNWLDDEATAVRACPGATTSGFAWPSYQVGPRELYAAMLSSLRLLVPFVSRAPTVMADGALPGEAMPAEPTSPVVGFFPKLPAETTTMMPARAAASTA